MTVYDALNQIESNSFEFLEISAFQDKSNNFDSERDKRIYDLIKNICSMYVKISDTKIEFQPFITLMEKRSFGIQDMTKEDYGLLESIDFSLLPVNIRARLADLLWTEKKIYSYAIVAINSYMILFDQLFSDDEWLESLNMIRRAISISISINEKEKCTEACESVYKHILRIDGMDKSFLSIRLISIVIRKKYGDIDTIINILNKIIMNNHSNVHIVEATYKLLGDCFKWKGDNAGVYDARIALGHYYEAKAEELTGDDFRSLSIAVDYLQKSIFIYRNCKLAEKAEKAQKKMVFLQSKIPQTMGVIHRKYDVSNLSQYMNEVFDGLSFSEALLRLIQFTSFRKKEDMKKDVLNALKEYPLSHLFGKKAINSAGQTTFALKPLDMHDPESDSQILNAHIHQRLLEYETIDGDLFLRIALGIIRNKYDFQITDLDFLIQDNPIIPQGRESIFKSAVYMALKGQEYEAIHILSSQIENLFRNLARELGALTVTLEDDGTSKQKLLTSVFDLPELVDAYDNNILFLFKGLLNEQAGANIRNNVAHGLLTETSAKSGVCIYFICAVIRLLSYTSSECVNILNSPKLKDLKPPDRDIMPVLS
ncbi:DUF4209 domain-containing protein [Acutalibacter caecimuris]|uniref:DUF4209 domain-containing protein n=1 Tax=Acutalibacter caecimuris TaxID=3093657 RepID=UPI002AC963A2|nr:DUF4209 domain-containing protein [Acutalibacter sp. M00118]